jgi:cytochrome c553
MTHRWLAAALAAAFTTWPAWGQSPDKTDPARGRQIATQICAACHGPDGNSVLPENPVLAGQHAAYTLKQLEDFKARDGKPPARANAVMAGMVANLTAEDMRSLAAYFAAQAPKPRAARDAELARRGQDIYRGGIFAKRVAACSACHGPAGAGVPTQFPRLAGQHAQYVAAQLRAFRSGERANDPSGMMRSIAERLTDKEIAAVAEYVSGLR